MDIEQMIKKWDKQIALHRRVCDDPLMYTKEERLKNSHYAQAICAVLADLKQVKNIADGDGSEITTEMLMNNEHEISDDFGWVKIKQCNRKEKFADCPKEPNNSHCNQFGSCYF